MLESHFSCRITTHIQQHFYVKSYYFIFLHLNNQEIQNDSPYSINLFKSVP